MFPPRFRNRLIAIGALASTAALAYAGFDTRTFRLEPVEDPQAQNAAQPADQQATPADKPATAREEVPPPASHEPVAITPGYLSDRATFAISKSRFHDDPEVLWAGFLNGLRGFEHFYDPIGNPIYFESPFNTTGMRLLYLHHDFPDDSQLGGGDLNVYALQIRLALTERLGFIATKDGYSDLNARILPNAEGWNNFAIGLKYAFWVDRDADWVMSGGLRWEWENGDLDILQGGDQELSPFISFAKGFDQFHLLGNVTGRVPCDGDRGNCILQWDLHADYEIAPETLPGFAPVFEVHGLHYLSDGEHMPLSVGGLDYTNLGSTDVAGSGVVWGGVGFRWKLTPHVSIGSTWEFPMTDPDHDIMGNRLTADVTLAW